jgi:hypothetical protein
LEYLGHIISASGVATAPGKIKAVQNWKSPTDTKQLRSFLGLAGYYRKFIKNYGLISRPLTDILKKNTPFLWTLQLQQSFEELKHALVTTPVLRLPNFAKPFLVETDASDRGVGASVDARGPPHSILKQGTQ